MVSVRIIFLICCALLAVMSCKKSNSSDPSSLFDSIPVSVPLVPLVAEVSGIADSKIYPGHLWAHEDSGAPTQLHLVNHNGTVTKTVYLKGISNRDWEDMTISGGAVYLAETGDNALAYADYSIYKFQEPSGSADTVFSFERIRFIYPDGKHDAEALLVDESSGDIFIITKNDNPSRVYRIDFPFSAMNTASPVMELDYSGVVSASLYGSEIVIKTYTGIFYYKGKPGDGIQQILQQEGGKLKYQVEPQGEAIGFAQNGSGFFTLSEKGFASSVHLNFYKRN